MKVELAQKKKKEFTGEYLCKEYSADRWEICRTTDVSDEKNPDRGRTSDGRRRKTERGGQEKNRTGKSNFAGEKGTFFLK